MPSGKILGSFCNHCESCVQDVKNVVLVIRVSCYNFLSERKTVLSHFVFFLIIVKSLQFRGRRQIAELRKYYLEHEIIFLWRVFSLFLFLTV